jgi:sn-glycerol 3-phosphate transport system permease protein
MRIRGFQSSIVNRQSFFRLTLIYGLLVATALFIGFPLLYGLAISFMTPDQVMEYPPRFLPDGLNFASYQTVLNRLPIPRYLLNSLIVSSAVMFGQLVTASLAAYAFAIRSFRGSGLLFGLFLATLMIPWEVTIIPNFQTITGWGWGDNYIGLIAPFVATGFGVFMLRQFFMTIPKELHDAATIDGCGSLRYLLQIVIPLSRPALGTLAIYSFLQTWNQFLWPLLITNKKEMRTIQIGLNYLLNEETISFNNTMAGVMLAILPTVLLLILGQRQLIRGLTTGAIKG